MTMRGRTKDPAKRPCGPIEDAVRQKIPFTTGRPSSAIGRDHRKNASIRLIATILESYTKK